MSGQVEGSGCERPVRFDLFERLPHIVARFFAPDTSGGQNDMLRLSAGVPHPIVTRTLCVVPSFCAGTTFPPMSFPSSVTDVTPFSTPFEFSTLIS